MAHLATITAQVLYLFLPLLTVAIVSGIILRNDLWRRINRPIDHHATFRRRRIFGDNKTWRGVICAIVCCTATVALQKYLIGDRASAISIVDYGEVNFLWLGAGLGVGAVLGELPNSFLKRQLDIPPGSSARGVLLPLFYVWDQVDLLFTTWPVLLFWVQPTWQLILTSFVVVLAGHQLISVVGYCGGARKSSR
jgi:CDP-2,3-bis-(O-geranylgeranyl)-sn-glycerol synthase